VAESAAVSVIVAAGRDMGIAVIVGCVGSEAVAAGTWADAVAGMSIAAARAKARRERIE